jgi:hypothetical protein
LLLHKASPSHNSTEEQTKTLLYAVKKRNEEALQLMSIYGKHFVPPHEYTALTIQAARPEDAIRLVLAYMEMMSNAKFALEPADQTELLQACLQGNEASVKAWFKEKGRPFAAFNGRSRNYSRWRDRASQMLFEHGADHDAAQGRRSYPMLLKDQTRYSSLGDAEGFRALERGVHLEPLRWAIASGNSEVA